MPMHVPLAALGATAGTASVMAAAAAAAAIAGLAARRRLRRRRSGKNASAAGASEPSKVVGRRSAAAAAAARHVAYACAPGAGALAAQAFGQLQPPSPPPLPVLPPQDLSPLMHTALQTAGMRCSEADFVSSPLIDDPVACVLATEFGRRCCAAEKAARRQRGSGKGGCTGREERHDQICARARILDDDVGAAVRELAAQRTHCGGGGGSVAGSGGPPNVQVVCLGCGMDTRPWRMQVPCASAHVQWFEVDQAPVIELKAKLLREAGVDLGPRRASCTRVGMLECADACEVKGQHGACEVHDRACAVKGQHRTYDVTGQHGAGTAVHDDYGGGGTVVPDGGGCAGTAAERGRPGRGWPPLGVDELHSIVCDLSCPQALSAALSAAGFSPAVPTVWVLEGLIYYLNLEATEQLLSSCAVLSAPNSRLFMTAVSRRCVAAAAAAAAEAPPPLSWFRLEHSWEDLVSASGRPGRMARCGWEGVGVSSPLTSVAYARYGTLCHPHYPRFLTAARPLPHEEHVVSAVLAPAGPAGGGGARRRRRSCSRHAA